MCTLCEISRHHGVDRYQSTCVRGTPTAPSRSEDTGLLEFVSPSLSSGNACDATESESVWVVEEISDGNEKHLNKAKKRGPESGVIPAAMRDYSNTSRNAAQATQSTRNRAKTPQALLHLLTQTEFRERWIFLLHRGRHRSVHKEAQFPPQPTAQDRLTGTDRNKKASTSESD